jgi:hypothetical protein
VGALGRLRRKVEGTGVAREMALAIDRAAQKRGITMEAYMICGPGFAVCVGG